MTLLRHGRALSCGADGSALGLSATDAYGQSLAVIPRQYTQFRTVPGKFDKACPNDHRLSAAWSNAPRAVVPNFLTALSLCFLGAQCAPPDPQSKATAEHISTQPSHDRFEPSLPERGAMAHQKSRPRRTRQLGPLPDTRSTKGAAGKEGAVGVDRDRRLARRGAHHRGRDRGL